MQPPSYVNRLSKVPQLTAEDQTALAPVSARFAFRTNTYYQSLIDWDDPDDPIRRIIMPNTGEVRDWGLLDASDEEAYTVARGTEHKYASTALLLVTNICGGYCRFCFRKRLFMPENDEVSIDVTEGVRYIRQHPEVSNVLLTGGDPLTLSTGRLRDILNQLAAIPHVRIVRVGSKMPALNPIRIVNDPSLCELIREFSQTRTLYVMAHFNHPRELTAVAREALSLLRAAGAVIVNQTPLIRKVNDTPEVLTNLFDTLSFIGVPPYYVFQCRPTLGNEIFSVPIEEAFRTFALAQSRCSGLAKRARFVMSHRSGKVEVVGVANGSVYMRYHQAADPRNIGRMLVLRSNPRARWLDDYEEIAEAAATERELAAVGLDARNGTLDELECDAEVVAR